MLGSGCKSADMSSMSPGSEVAYERQAMEEAFGYDPMQPDNTQAGGEYDFADDEMAGGEEPAPSPEMMSISVSSESRQGGRGWGRKSKKARGDSGQTIDFEDSNRPARKREEAKAEPLEQPEDPGPSAKSPDKEEDSADDHGRQIIYTAAMVVAVHDVNDATERAEKFPQTFGGYVHQRSNGLVILKIPAKNLRKAMDAIAAYGIVQARQLQAQDVTAEYTDLESRIRVLRDTQAQLLRLLEQAKTVEETLQVRQALDRVTMELETALGRMRQLGDAISFSTLTVRFQQRSPQHHLPSSNDPFGWVDQLGVESTEWR